MSETASTATDAGVEALPKAINHMSNLTQGGEALELLAATVDRTAFPGKAEWILSGHDDVLIDGKDALRAIEDALTHKSTEEERLREALIEECAKVAADYVNEKNAHPEYNMACWDIEAAIRRLALSPEGEEGLDG